MKHSQNAFHSLSAAHLPGPFFSHKQSVLVICAAYKLNSLSELLYCTIQNHHLTVTAKLVSSNFNTQLDFIIAKKQTPSCYYCLFSHGKLLIEVVHSIH
jgi:hypothetical protein